MRIESFLERLDAVRPRGIDRWTARCPAHDDRRPSLSVSDGERGLLVKCWSGCTLAEIAGALGLDVRNLFHDDGANPREWQKTRSNRLAARSRRQRIALVDGLFVDACREAERLILSAKNIDISQWSDEQLSEALHRLANAHDILERDEVYG